MATKTKTKTRTQNLTVKQAQVKVTNLLKGIDNNNVAISKKLEENENAVKQVQMLFPSALTQPDVKPAQAKDLKTAKKAKAKETATNEAVKQTKTKPAAKTATQDNRPPLKQVIVEILTKAGKSVGAAEIFRTACAEYGTWSRQSVYNALEKHFERADEGYKLHEKVISNSQRSPDEKDEADLFVDSVEAVQSTASVV
jgi:hypothetical protein